MPQTGDILKERISSAGGESAYDPVASPMCDLTTLQRLNPCIDDRTNN